MAGYSKTSLSKKLGIKAGLKILVVQEPDGYWEWLAPLPDVTVVQKPAKQTLDFAHVFVQSQRDFEKIFNKVKSMLTKSGMLWISWPKKSSGIISDLDENKIREFGLANGLVDVKVCAVDDTWSGLKFVYRIKDR
ncbi:MAG: DUF3052 domain-containing protein [Cyclobacteriaceae bacterium]|nr:DUF3052 domain-containing protein [Cyclobacteriaceae bacterium]